MELGPEGLGQAYKSGLLIITVLGMPNDIGRLEKAAVELVARADRTTAPHAPVSSIAAIRAG